MSTSVVVYIYWFLRKYKRCYVYFYSSCRVVQRTILLAHTKSGRIHRYNIDDSYLEYAGSLCLFKNFPAYEIHVIVEMVIVIILDQYVCCLALRTVGSTPEQYEICF